VGAGGEPPLGGKCWGEPSQFGRAPHQTVQVKKRPTTPKVKKEGKFRLRTLRRPGNGWGFLKNQGEMGKNESKKPGPNFFRGAPGRSLTRLFLGKTLGEAPFETPGRKSGGGLKRINPSPKENFGPNVEKQGNGLKPR